MTTSNIDYNLRLPSSFEPKIPESAPKNYTPYRVLTAALPLVVLVPSIAQALQYVAGIASCYESAKNLRAKPDEKLKKIASLSFNVTSLALLAINPLAVSILQSGWDGLQESIQMSSHLVNGEYKEAAWHGVKVAEKSIYIASILVGGPELVLISMVAQISFEILKLNQFRVLDMKLELSVQFAVIGVRSYGVYNHLKLHEDHFQKAYKKIETQFFQLIGKYQKICDDINTSPLLNVIGVKIDEFNDFIKTYASSVEKTFGWSEVVYALEKDYPDEIVLLCIDKIGSGNLQYSSRVEEWNSNKTDIHYKHVYFTCVIKNRPEILQAILNNKNATELDVNVSEYIMKEFRNYRRPQKIQERQLLNFLIEESNNSSIFFEIFKQYKLDVNKNEVYVNMPFGSGISQKEDHFRTPLISAILKGKLDDVKFLLKHSASPNLTSLPHSESPLIIAIKNKRLDISSALLDKNADVNDGSLIYAVSVNYLDAVSLLLKYKADPLKKFSNRSAYEIAVLGDKYEIIEIISGAVHPTAVLKNHSDEQVENEIKAQKKIVIDLKNKINQQNLNDEKQQKNIISMQKTLDLVKHELKELELKLVDQQKIINSLKNKSEEFKAKNELLLSQEEAKLQLRLSPAWMEKRKAVDEMIFSFSKFFSLADRINFGTPKCLNTLEDCKKILGFLRIGSLEQHHQNEIQEMYDQLKKMQNIKDYTKQIESSFNKKFNEILAYYSQ